MTLSPSKADTSNTWLKSELQFLDAVQEISWSSAGTSLDKGQTSLYSSDYSGSQQDCQAGEAYLERRGCLV